MKKVVGIVGSGRTCGKTDFFRELTLKMGYEAKEFIIVQGGFMNGKSFSKELSGSAPQDFSHTIEAKVTGSALDGIVYPPEPVIKTKRRIKNKFAR